ncbi:MAG: hypothetical protein JO352_31560 [Chloroflexi bacterium]|nr:hypothetical protein [Chloroflexota bacterium]MBV9597404.1 hypothetical protein [Chloroflexota bacterium]
MTRGPAWTFAAGVVLGVAATLYGVLGQVRPAEIQPYLPQLHAYASHSVSDQALDNAVVVSLVQ